jgi:replicative DNA helicase
MLQKAANQKEGLSGLRTGFNALDKITSGWQNSDLVINRRPSCDGVKQPLSFLWQEYGCKLQYSCCLVFA